MLSLSIETISAEPEKTRASISQDNTWVPLRWHRKKWLAVFGRDYGQHSK